MHGVSKSPGVPSRHLSPAEINSRSSGFSLVELLIGVFLSVVLMSALVQLMAGSTAAYRLQLAQSQLEETGRYAREVLLRHIAPAGYQPEPWLEDSDLAALTEESLDGGDRRGDRLGLQRWSRYNCFGNPNPATDATGLPAFYLLKTYLRVNTARNLAITCRYGRKDSDLVTQINGFGVVEGVETMQLLYAEDTSGNGIPDRWVAAQGWQDEETVKAVRVALLLTTEPGVGPAESQSLMLMDNAITAPPDGRLRAVRTYTVAIRGRRL